VNSFNQLSLRGIVVVLLGSMFFTAAAQAAISGINTPGTSNASITFDDTNSVAPPNGLTNGGPSVRPWTGATVTLPLTTDPITFDFAQGSIDGNFVGNSYAINLNNVTLNQMPANTGFAHLNFAFNIEYQLDGAGLPSQPTLYPNFIVNGTVQPTGFAAIGGYINYSGVNTAGTISTFETVNYNGFWNTPGPFSGTVSGVPVNGTTPALIANTTLTLDGYLSFMVDPASINAFSVMVPEPSSLALVATALGLVGAGARSRRRRGSC
jgi:hypothetical protein